MATTSKTTPKPVAVRDMKPTVKRPNKLKEAPTIDMMFASMRQPGGPTTLSMSVSGADFMKQRQIAFKIIEIGVHGKTGKEWVVVFQYRTIAEGPLQFGDAMFCEETRTGIFGNIDQRNLNRMN